MDDAGRLRKSNTTPEHLDDAVVPSYVHFSPPPKLNPARVLIFPLYQSVLLMQALKDPAFAFTVL